MSKLKRRNLYSLFDGTTSYIQYADADVFSFVSADGLSDLPFSIEFDLYLKSIDAFTCILNKRDTGAVPIEYQMWVCAGVIRVYLFSEGSSANDIYAYSTPTLVANTNYRIKITYDASGVYTGINIYINNVLAAKTGGVAGTYVHMHNTSAPVVIGKVTNTSLYYLNGYLRNLKITKNNQLVFQATLQDTLNVSKDIIGGLVATTVNAVNVVDINEGGNWALYDGLTSISSIGTTSTMGWINSGIFNMQFDFKKITNTAGYIVANAGLSTAHKGILFYNQTGAIRVYMPNGTSAVFDNNGGGSMVLNTSYRITLQGNGTQYRYIQDNLDTGVNFYDSGWVACTYVPFATTTYAQSLGGVGSGRGNIQLRNFKIYSDTAGTIPFMSLPLQSKDDLMIDRVSGLVGTQTDVKIINNNTNILKSQNKWMQFDTIAASYMDFGTTSTLRFINDTGIFRIEFEYTHSSKTTQYVLYTDGGYSVTGFNIQCSPTTIGFYMRNAAGGALTNQSVNVIVGNSYKIKMYGDGVRAYIDLNGVIISQAYSGVFRVGTTNNAPRFGAASGSYCIGKIRDFRIYSSTDQSNLLYNFPFQDSLNIGKSVTGGLNGTIVGAFSIINQTESQNWAYFKRTVYGTVSQLAIGTTSTLGWMNTGIFKLEFDYKQLDSIDSAIIVATSVSAGGHGFYFYLVSSKLYARWDNGTTEQSIIPTTAITIGEKYNIVLKGNGTQLQYIITNLSTGAVHYDSGLVACTFVPFATTFYAPFSNYGFGTKAEHYVRNLKIYTDFAGTIPFMSLPMQDAPTLITDRITGLQGTAYNVSIVNNNQNVLRTKNLWALFLKTVSSYINIGTTSTLGWMNTGIFKVQLDVIIIDCPLGTYLLGNNGAPATRGFRFGFSTITGSYQKITAVWTNNTGSYVINWVGVNLLIGSPYRLILQGNGTQIRYIQYDLTTKANVYDSGWGNVTYTPFATTSYSLYVDGLNGAAKCNIKDVKIFSDTDGNAPFMHLPMQDGGGISKDVVGGLVGTIVGTVNIVEI